MEAQFKEVEQRSEEWFELRRGRFTASRISELLASGTRPMTPTELAAYKIAEPKGKKKNTACVGEGLKTYAHECAVEKLYGVDTEDNFVSFDMQRGIDLEPLALRKLRELLEDEFITIKEVGFLTYGDDSGASSDGYASNGINVEFKCPKRNKFFKLVRLGIEAVDPNYIDQMQKQMLCNGAKETYFFNYYVNPEGKEYYHLIMVPRDEVRISLIKERIKIAVEYRDQYIIELQNNQQF